MGKNEEQKLIEEYFSLEEMFDGETVELFKLKNGIVGDISIDVFTEYINRYIFYYLDSTMSLSTPELYC
jgi:hypothetical protein